MANLKSKIKGGFTLVELIVSLAITGILLVGLSIFFTSTFHNMFTAQERTSGTQSQFALNEILRDKLTSLEEILYIAANEIVFRSDTTDGQMPFTYVGQDGDNIVFKDFFVFNGLFGSTSGDEFDPIENPGGIVYLNDEMIDYYYITAPLENKIYRCPSPPAMGGCWEPSPAIEGLNRPTDITADDMDFNTANLYVTNSGDNTVIRISNLENTNTVTTLVDEGLNFPTGLAYYDNGTQKYLFIADTYNNEIKWIPTNLLLNDYPTNAITAVGNGEDTSCDNTAKYCQLNFPTGLHANDSDHILYISDTGSNRILKMSDPDPALDDYEIAFNLGIASQISEINFVFPDDVTLSNVSESNPNTLHTGKYTENGSTLTYELNVPIEDDVIHPTLVCAGSPPVCINRNYFIGFEVIAENQIFEANDSIQLGSESYTVDGISDIGGGIYQITVIPADTVINYAQGTIVTITNNFLAGDYEFYFDLTSSTFASDFNNIETEVSDDTPVVIKTVEQMLRVGDDILGTSEDSIEVLYDTDLNFPTGLSISGSDLMTADSLDGQILEDGAFDSSLTPYAIPTSNFDYTSDFTLNSPLSFTTYNGGSILELEIHAVNDLGDADPLNDITETYTLTTAIN
ncbi:prepilin-type N-terminal cleavage/methylation domain-containing protein [Patescibacteria group bacterium]|nr:prepilin-type N-terminal cleavage/methylation domain-containing protein [Patescibacteria group bacterium]MBU1683360.1 prepilin-type N-terminal cleavage/methylation domain-containing protein [Patescibacteria group bacterium]